jgi:hypothetical protein
MLIADRFTAGKNQKQSSAWEQSAVSIQRTARECNSTIARCCNFVLKLMGVHQEDFPSLYSSINPQR